jgi:hypothetical protein
VWSCLGPTLEPGGSKVHGNARLTPGWSSHVGDADRIGSSSCSCGRGDGDLPPDRDSTSLTSQNLYWRLRAACYRRMPGVVRFYDTNSLPRLVEDQGLTVVEYTTKTSRFTGKIHWVQIDLGDDDHDHYIDPEERFRITMARQ